MEMQYPAMQDYSQNKEQGVILGYFQPPRFEYLVGTFLDVGANDGAVLSNTRMLALMGWSGVCVEPAEIAFKKLVALYPPSLPENPAWSSAVKCVQAAITTTDGPIDFYDSGTHLKKGDTSLLSTTKPEEMARWKKSGEVFTKTTVRGITFATLLAETGVNHFDFISVDCEGVDWHILQQIDLTAVGCRMLCVEANQSPHRQKFVDYAAKHGMKLHWKSYENLIFTRG